MNYTIQDYINNFIYLKKKCKIIRIDGTTLYIIMDFITKKEYKLNLLKVPKHKCIEKYLKLLTLNKILYLKINTMFDDFIIGELFNGDILINHLLIKHYVNYKKKQNKPKFIVPNIKKFILDVIEEEN